MSLSAIKNRLVLVLGLVLAFGLAACGGEDSPSAPSEDATASEDAADSGASSDAGSSSAMLDSVSQYFIESFDEFQAAAQDLIEADARYDVQNLTWYFDLNNNKKFDSRTETRYTTYPLLSAGVHYAHAAGLTGAGQTVAIVDDGFLQQHEVFRDGQLSISGSPSDEDHGTHTASVVAGSSSTMIGIAPGANLLLGGYDTSQTRADATRDAIALGAVSQSNSWGFIGTSASQTSHDEIFSGTSGQAYLSALKDYAKTGVVVFSSSNETNDTQSTLMPSLPVIHPELEAGWLAAINADAEMDGDDIIGAKRISAACFEAAPWCLAAEGTWYGAIASGTDSYAYNTGTSFSAPMISGALALLAEAFPDLTAHQLRIRLLASADNSFEGFTSDGSVELAEGFSHDYSDEWGHGFVNVKNALLPIGEPKVTQNDGTTLTPLKPMMISGSASGDAVSRSLGDVRVLAQDDLAGRFSLPAVSLVQPVAPTPLGGELLRAWRVGAGASCCGIESYFPKAHELGLNAADFHIAAFVPDNRFDDASFGVIVGKQYTIQNVELTAKLGIGRAGGDLLPSWRGHGAAQMTSAALSAMAWIDGSQTVEFSSAFGHVAGNGNSSALLLNSASARYAARNVLARGDKLTLSAALPAAIRHGSGRVSLPIAISGGISAYREVAINMVPQAREFRLGLNYETPLGGAADSTLSLGLSFAHNHGNIAGNTDAAVLFGFKTQF